MMWQSVGRTCNDERERVVGRRSGERDSQSALVDLAERPHQVHHHVDLRALVELRLGPVDRVVEQVEAVVGRLLELAVDEHRVVDVGQQPLASRQHQQRVAWSTNPNR